MTDTPKISQKQREQERAAVRKAEALRANLRRRKQASHSPSKPNAAK